MSKSMAEVLAEHHIIYKWDRDFGENVWLCTTRECVFGTDHFERAIDHQAAALTAAGFGLVADAKAEAWDECAAWVALGHELAPGVIQAANPYREAGRDDQ